MAFDERIKILEYNASLRPNLVPETNLIESSILVYSVQDFNIVLYVQGNPFECKCERIFVVKARVVLHNWFSAPCYSLVREYLNVQDNAHESSCIAIWYDDRQVEEFNYTLPIQSNWLYFQLGVFCNILIYCVITSVSRCSITPLPRNMALKCSHAEQAVLLELGRMLWDIFMRMWSCTRAWRCFYNVLGYVRAPIEHDGALFDHTNIQKNDAIAKPIQFASSRWQHQAQPATEAHKVKDPALSLPLEGMSTNI